MEVFFIDGGGIEFDVLLRYLAKHLGPDAVCRQEVYNVRQFLCGKISRCIDLSAGYQRLHDHC